jgi:AcrR family transcriptional regulator
MALSSRDRMIVAGERLVAERGIEALSLREVQAVAGQRNKSAAHYHFGSKIGLIEAIFEHRFAPIDQAMVERLTDLDKDPLPPDLRSLVAALVQPLTDALGHNGATWHARFLAHVQTDPDLSVDLLEKGEVFAAARDILDRITPFLTSLPLAVRQERQELVFGFIVGALAAREAAIQVGTSTPATIPLLRGDLVDVAVAMLEAPVSAGTAAKLRPHRPRVRNRQANRNQPSRSQAGPVKRRAVTAR